MLSSQALPDLDREGFPAEHIDHGQHPELLPVAQLIMDEVQAPRLVQTLGFATRFPMNDYLAPARLFGAQCQAQLGAERIVSPPGCGRHQPDAADCDRCTRPTVDDRVAALPRTWGDPRGRHCKSLRPASSSMRRLVEVDATGRMLDHTSSIEAEMGPFNARPLRARGMVARARSSTGYEDMRWLVRRQTQGLTLARQRQWRLIYLHEQ